MQQNIIFFLIDGLRADQFYGNDRTCKTPNIDCLKKRGVCFTQAISSADGTFTSLNSLLTANFPFRNGVRTRKILLKEKGHNDNEINISAIKGPCLATGLANKMRTGTVIANPDIKEAQFLKKIISTDYYSTEISNDIIGVELSGAIKNIYSMLIGASEGLSNSKAPIEIQSKYYLNTSASLIHRSISEMVEFVSLYGGNSETVYGLAGLGDLYVSAIGGRNSLMGKYLGQGHLYQDAKQLYMKDITVEGAELAFEIGPIIFKDLKEKDFPLMFSVLKSICENKKLEINW